MKKLLMVLMGLIAVSQTQANPAMSSQGDKYWQTVRPLRHVKKLRNKIDVPAFSLTSGSAWSYRQSDDTDIALYTSDPNTITSGFTVSGWIKVDTNDTTGLDFGYVLFANGEPGGDASLVVSVENGKLTVNILTSDPYVIVSDATIPEGVWTHIAVTYTAGDINVEGQLQLWINGGLAVIDGDDSVGEGGLQAGGADSYFGDDYTFAAGQGYNISNVSFWDYPLDMDTLQWHMFNIPSIYTPGLLIWVTFNNNPSSPSNSIPVNLVTGNQLVWDTFTMTETYPFCAVYGGSFIVGEFTLTVESGLPFALSFPVRKPTDCTNWFPCVSWVEENCDCPYPVVKRYQLWHVCPEECIADETPNCGEDVTALQIPDYNGETIPSGAKLEIWSIDGESLAELDDTLTLLTSVLSVVTSSTDTSNPDLLTLTTPSTDIAETYPLTFPLAFDQPLVIA